MRIACVGRWYSVCGNSDNMRKNRQMQRYRTQLRPKEGSMLEQLWFRFQYTKLYNQCGLTGSYIGAWYVEISSIATVELLWSYATRMGCFIISCLCTIVFSVRSKPPWANPQTLSEAVAGVVVVVVSLLLPFFILKFVEIFKLIMIQLTLTCAAVDLLF